jgi:radical SAM protein with 4Fe4S-binding SPASM domain
VATSLVITCLNWDRIEDALDRAMGLGANQVVCNRFVGAPIAGVTPIQSQLRAAVAVVESLRAAGRPIRFGNCIPQCFAVSSSRGCTAGSTFATVDPWGRVRPCNHAPFIVGDLRTQSVQEVWIGQRMSAWRSLVPAECAPCPAYAACHGGCRAEAMLTGQDWDPLIRGPLAAAAPPPGPELPLYAGLRPSGQFTCRLEGGIPVLLHKSRVIPLPTGYERQVPHLDGSLTLRHIERRYGHAVVDWIGALHQQGLVTWSARAAGINDNGQ